MHTGILKEKGKKIVVVNMVIKVHVHMYIYIYIQPLKVNPSHMIFQMSESMQLIVINLNYKVTIFC